MPVLTVHALRYRYGSKVAVDGIDLAVRRGEVFGLLGPNGAGKSTTIALCVGLLRPASGTVTYHGLSGLPADDGPHRRAVRRRLGVATQALALYEELSARENLAFFGRVQGLADRAELDRRVAEALDLVGLTDVGRDPVSSFSGGMKRRLNLAVAVVHRPEVVLLDEPTVGVDPQSRNAIFERVLALRDAGVTVVYTTHYMEEAQRLCDRIAILDGGRIIGLDSVEGLIDAHGGRGRLVYRRDGREAVVETNEPVEALNRLRSEGVVETFRYQPPDLESVFLELTGRALRD